MLYTSSDVYVLDCILNYESDVKVIVGSIINIINRGQLYFVINALNYDKNILQNSYYCKFVFP